jgi:hypothetical protein
VSDSWTNIQAYFVGAGATENTKVKSFTIVWWVSNDKSTKFLCK